MPPNQNTIFDHSPFPHRPLQDAPFSDWNALFLHCIHTARYRRDRLHHPSAPPPRILDVGCGSGWKTMLLAAANPGATITAIDPSPISLDVAARRIQFHGIKDVQLILAGLSEVPDLGEQFDYINCDELFYLLPDMSPQEALFLLRDCLAPGGIIRFNLHDRYQREACYRGQELFRILGLMDGSPGEKEAATVSAFMRALAPETDLRRKAWTTHFESANATEHILMNFLLPYDKGSTIDDLFLILKNANLDFISMVNWDQWDLEKLFENGTLPPLLTAFSPQNNPHFALRVFELLHPVHRRLDAWAGKLQKPLATPEPLAPSTLLQLHPVLQSEFFLNTAYTAQKNQSPLRLRDFIKVSSAKPLDIEPDDLPSFLRLWESPLTFAELTHGTSDRFRNLIHRLDTACLLLRCAAR